MAQPTSVSVVKVFDLRVTAIPAEVFVLQSIGSLPPAYCEFLNFLLLFLYPSFINLTTFLLVLPS